MALQAFSVKRIQEAADANANIVEITPKSWRRFPTSGPPVGGSLPIYVPTVTYVGGVQGDDVAVATANSTTPYAPTTQAAKATALGTTIVVDTGRRRGPLGPSDPYPVTGYTPLAAPVITSLAPNTAVAGTDPNLIVTITGTGFSAWSAVTSGGFTIPFRYISPTKLEIVQKPKASIAGIVQVVVSDHGVASAPSNFTFT
jgi:hypothetical protein